MSKSSAALAFASLAMAGLLQLSPVMAADSPPTLVIHGGAGISRAQLTPEKEAACRAVLEAALRAGHRILSEGGASVSAVEEAIVILEDSPLFNAGRGSVLTSAGTVEMDASIMNGGKAGAEGLREGSNLPSAGAVAAVRGVRNPIRLARLVMERTPHVLLVGAGAEDFARNCGVRFEPAEYFITPEQKEKLRKAQAGNAAADAASVDLTTQTGTVGAVALDKSGRLTAGTSTGGLTNKRPGRAGDSPLIGAGNYAENGVCAVSCTGHGESFIRAVAAYDLAARMKYAGRDVASAAREVIHERLPQIGGTGGLIAIDVHGNVATPFNTPGMFHGWIKGDGSIHVAIFEE